MNEDEDRGPESDRGASAGSAASDREVGTVVREGEVTDSVESSGRRESETPTERLETAAGAFLAVEDRLGSAEGTWLAVDVEVIPAESVPADYPEGVSTAESLELVLEPPGGGSEESLYLEFPDDGVVTPESDLGRLLERLSIPAERFGDLLGEPIPVSQSEGTLVLDGSTRFRRGTDRALVGLLGGFALLVAAWTAIVAGAGSLLASPLALVVLAAVNFVALPLSTYLDGWHLRTTTRWRHAPGMWALLAVLPGINLVTTVVYLLSRRAATTGR